MNRREAHGGGGTAPPSTAMALNTPVGGGGGLKSLADLNRRNQDAYPPSPLPQRRKDGSIIDPLFPKREVKS